MICLEVCALLSACALFHINFKDAAEIRVQEIYAAFRRLLICDVDGCHDMWPYCQQDVANILKCNCIDLTVTITLES